MRHPTPERSQHLGMREGELDGKPYARFWNPRMAPLPEHAREAVVQGPVAGPLLPALTDAPRMLEPGDQPLENGYGFFRDGALHVAVRTDLPDVRPEMIDWWFAWHSDEPQRYKLWHPRAHVHAAWDAPGSGYVGRTSFVDEYLGSTLSHIAISFVPPSELGFPSFHEETVVCARIRFVGQPLDVGWLVHHVRKVPGGAEMRSRFWLGGKHASLRGAGALGGAVARVAQTFIGPTEATGRDLLVHCSQEMSHLGSFLPALYQELRDSAG